MVTALFSFLFLIVGAIVGWMTAEKFFLYLQEEPHQFDKIFEDNPHPEIYTKNGEIDKGEYMVVNFDLGYDPESFEPDDIVEDY